MGLGLSLAAHRSGERFQKFPDTAGKYAGYVWTQAVFVKTNLRFHKFPDTCGRCLKWTQNPSGSVSIARDVPTMCSNDRDNHTETPLIRMRDELHVEKAITIPWAELKSESGLKGQVKTTSWHLSHICTDICLKLTFLHPKRQFITLLLVVSRYDFVDLVSCRSARTNFWSQPLNALSSSPPWSSSWIKKSKKYVVTPKHRGKPFSCIKIAQME